MISSDVINWNISNLFMVPLLNIGRNRLSQQGFIESFLYNGEEEVSFKNGIYLLFLPGDIKDFNNFIVEERERTTIIEEYAHPGNYMLIAYELPKRFKRDYKLIIEGKYSQLSDAFKKAIPAYLKVADNSKIVEIETVQHMIFNKSPELKKHFETMFGVDLDDEQELWKIFDKEKETFKISNYEQLFTESPRGTEQEGDY